MPKLVTMLTALAAAMGWPGTALAQDGDEQGTICILPLYLWSSTNADIARIREQPVPESFRRGFTMAGPCGTLYPLFGETLTRWHRDFGDEASVTAALRFLEGPPTSLPEPDAFLADLQRGWQQARRLLTQRQGRRLPGNNHPAMLRLRELGETRTAFLVLADRYVRAAAAFRSEVLLRRAETMLDVLRRSSDVVTPVDGAAGEMLAEAREPFLINHRISDLVFAEIETEVAITRARLSRLSGDIDRAQTLLDRRANAAFDRVEPRLGLDALCDDIGPNQEALRQACDNGDGDIGQRAAEYWRQRATLDIIRMDVPSAERDCGEGDSLERARTALTQQSEQDAAIEDTRRVQLAELEAHYADLCVRRAQQNEVGSWERTQQLRTGLDSLARALTTVSPAMQPTRFRRFANAYLAAYAMLIAQRDEQDRFDVQARWAAYARTVLDRLDSIARGDAPAPNR